MTVLEPELALALDLGRRCGRIALRIQAGGDETLQTTDKPDDGGPVTRADLAVEAAIVEALRERFPDDAILAEESAGVGAEVGIRDASWRHGRVWMIDPVDGTSDFARGDDCWAIHIGLCIDGHPALGVVHEPAARRINWALDHRGTRGAWTRTGDGPERALVPAPQAPPRVRMVSSKSHRSNRTQLVAERLGIGDDQQLRTGSVGVKVGMVARGEAQLYAHPSIGTKLWDSCAPQVLLSACGGRLTDLCGEPIGYRGPTFTNDRGLLATGASVDHDEIVARLEPLAREWFPNDGAP